MITIDRDWFKVWTKPFYPVPDSEFGIVTSIYSPHFLSESERPEDDDYSTALTFAVFDSSVQDVHKAPTNVIPKKVPLGETYFGGPVSSDAAKSLESKKHLMLFSVFPLQRIDSHTLITHITNLCNDYLNNSLLKTYEDRSPNCIIIPCIENENNLVVDDISRKSPEMLIIRFFFKDKGRTLEGMFTQALSIIKSGRVWVCAQPDDKTLLRNMDEGFLEVISGYPSSQSQAMVWALVQAILYLKSYNVFSNEPMNSRPSRVRIYEAG
jgi:hypothetical protein